MNKLKNTKAITLIALVITIVVLLILAGITIGALTRNGLFDKAKTARDKSEKSQATETMNLKITNIQISSYSEKQELPDLQYLADKLCEDNDIEYVLSKSKNQASLDKIDVTNVASIFTKLKEYPYEFEIDNELKLKSIDGIKVADKDTTSTKAKIYITDVGTASFVINVEAEDANNIALYRYYVNGKLVYQGIESNYKVEGLNAKTTYDVEVRVVPLKEYSVGTLKQETLYAPTIELSNKFDKYIYIDATNGNDTTGNGTSSEPYKTLNKITSSGIIEQGYSYGIVLKSGTYDFTSPMLSLKCNMSINFIGERQNTIIKWSELYTNGGYGTTNYSINYYRLVVSTNNAGDHGPTIKNASNFYNVVFNMKHNKTYDHYMPYSQPFNLYNCSSVGVATKLRCTHGTIHLTNCYGNFTNGYNTTEDKWNYQTNYITSTPSVDSNYKITESESTWKNVGTGTDLDGTTADLGVYGGEYSWLYKTDLEN